VWRKYFEAHPDGYRETQFRNHYNQWSKHVNSAMHVEHKAGDKMYVDYAGQHLQIVNDTTGEIKNVEVLPPSSGKPANLCRRTYSQQKEDLSHHAKMQFTIWRSAAGHRDRQFKVSSDQEQQV